MQGALGLNAFSLLLPVAALREWNPSPIHYPLRRRRRRWDFRFTLSDCLQLTITLGAIGLLIRGVYDSSIVLSFAAIAIILGMIGLFMEHIVARKV